MGQQGVAPTQGGPAHAPDMPLEMPGGHELRHHRLGADLRVPHIQRAALGKGLDQRRRQHQVTQAQRRKGDLAEGPDIQHPPLPIQRRQGCQRRAAVAVLAVVVVLDDPAAGALGPGQQLQAPRQAHDHAGGVLMRRGHIGQPTVRQLREFDAIQSFIVHRHAMQLGPRHREGQSGRAVPGILHRDAIAGVHQQLCTKANALLRATGDHNLLRRAGQAPGAAQVSRNQAAQARLPRRLAVTQQLQVRFAPESRLQLGPDAKGKQIEGRHTHPKSSRRTTRGPVHRVALDALHGQIVDNFTGCNPSGFG